MHRTQIYFEEQFFEELKRQANTLGISLSAYIRETLKKDMEEKKKKPSSIDLSNFSGMWKDRDLTQESLRNKAWKL
jgi:predicted DNA-binding ribbon-helix-helix protein